MHHRSKERLQKDNGYVVNTKWLSVYYSKALISIVIFSSSESDEEEAISAQSEYAFQLPLW